MTTIADNFNRADSSNISTGAPFAWTEVVGDWTIDTNELRQNDTGTILARADSDLASSDHYSQIFCVADGAAAPNYVGTCVRFAPAATTAYLFLQQRDGTVHHFYKVVAGSFTQLATFTSTTPLMLKTWKLSASGSTLEVFVDAVSKGTITDSAITAGVRGGVTANGFTSGNIKLDNFEAGDLGGTKAPPFDSGRRMRRNVLIRL